MRKKKKDIKKIIAGIDLGGTNVYMLLIDSKGKIYGEKHFPTLSEKGPDGVIENIILQLKDVVKKAGFNLKDIWRIGIGSPGPLDSKKGIIFGAVNLPGWKYVKLKEKIEKVTGVKTGVDNDANCAIYGEKWLGAGKNFNNIIGLTLGTGIGGGIIIDGKLIRGTNYNAGEIGHMSINPEGIVCKCGAKGCYEQYASASAIANFAKEKIKKGAKTIITEIVKGDINKITSKTVYEALLNNDKLAKEIWDEFIKFLAAGIANLLNIFNPELIVIAGGVINAGDKLFIPLRQAVKKQTFEIIYNVAKILPAKLGERAGAIGAAGLMLFEGDFYEL